MSLTINLVLPVQANQEDPSSIERGTSRPPKLLVGLQGNRPSGQNLRRDVFFADEPDCLGAAVDVEDQPHRDRDGDVGQVRADAAVVDAQLQLAGQGQGK